MFISKWDIYITPPQILENIVKEGIQRAADRVECCEILSSIYNTAIILINS